MSDGGAPAVSAPVLGRGKAGARSRKSGGMEANWFRNASQSVSQIASDDASPSRKRRRTSKQIVAASGDVARCFQARAPAGPHRPAKAPCAHGPQLNTV